MPDEHLPELAHWFRASEQALPDTSFSAAVMQAVRRRQRWQLWQRLVPLALLIALAAVLAPAIARCSLALLEWGTASGPQSASLLAAAVWAAAGLWWLARVRRGWR